MNDKRSVLDDWSDILPMDPVGGHRTPGITPLTFRSADVTHLVGIHGEEIVLAVMPDYVIVFQRSFGRPVKKAVCVIGQKRATYQGRYPDSTLW